MNLFVKASCISRVFAKLCYLKVVIPRTHTRRKKWFSRPPEASISRMTKLFGVKRDQISSSKPPMLDYTYDEYVVNMRWLNVNAPKTLIFTQKIIIFSHLVNACWPHGHRTCNPTLGTWRKLFGPFLPQTVWSYDSYSLRGVEKTIFFSLQRNDGITTFN